MENGLPAKAVEAAPKPSRLRIAWALSIICIAAAALITLTHAAFWHSDPARAQIANERLKPVPGPPAGRVEAVRPMMPTTNCAKGFEWRGSRCERTPIAAR